ncbi:MAG TPA: hypothetical protein VH724_10600 [Candidatus Angelobacter sp.]|jgi:hypothetical protein|nr:hypothetical protein [Candidatus Angelobacter sp.]
MAALSIILIAITALCLTWYALAQKRKDRKAREILRWMQSALGGRGHVMGLSWITPSRFRIPLRLTCAVFRRAWVLVDLHAQQTPAQWLMDKVRKRREVLIFQADLDFAPASSLQVQNFRWFARSGRKAAINRQGWQFEHLQSVMISTKAESHQEIASAMTSFRQSGNREFLAVSFQRRSPHFSATLPLEALAPDAPARTYILDAMRELAGNADVFPKNR